MYGVYTRNHIQTFDWLVPYVRQINKNPVRGSSWGKLFVHSVKNPDYSPYAGQELRDMIRQCISMDAVRGVQGGALAPSCHERKYTEKD